MKSQKELSIDGGDHRGPRAGAEVLDDFFIYNIRLRGSKIGQPIPGCGHCSVLADGTMLRINDELLDMNEEQTVFYEGKPFTGIAYEMEGDKLVCEIPYCEGIQEGVAKEYHANGNISGEHNYKRAVLHGKSKEWHEDGKLKSEADYEYSILIGKKGIKTGKKRSMKYKRTIHRSEYCKSIEKHMNRGGAHSRQGNTAFEFAHTNLCYREIQEFCLPL